MDLVKSYIMCKAYVDTQSNASTYDYYYPRPMISFVDDDGKTSSFSDYYTLLNSNGVKGSLSVLPNLVGTTGYITAENITTMIDNGWSILNHSTSTDSITTTNMSTIIPYSINKCKQAGFNGSDIFVYPNGNTDNDVQNYVRTKCSGAINCTGTVNSMPVNYSNIDRLFIDDSSDLTLIKSAIDTGISSNSWIVIGTHSYNGLVNLTEILQYVLSKSGVDIVTIIEGLALSKSTITNLTWNQIYDFSTDNYPTIKAYVDEQVGGAINGSY